MKVAIQGCAGSSGGISAHQGSSGESSAAPTWTSRGWWGASSSTSSLMPPARATESWLSRLNRESCARALAPWACGEAARRRGEHSGARASGLGVWVAG
mgnify:CR=1 FL=1